MEFHEAFGVLSANDDITTALFALTDKARRSLLGDVADALVRETAKPAFTVAWTYRVVRRAIEESLVGGLLALGFQQRLANAMGVALKSLVQAEVAKRS